MQLIPETARDMGVVNVFDPRENILGGSRYLRKMLDRFGGNIRLALAAYNAGPNAVTRYGGVPPFQETIRYIEKVSRAYRAMGGFNTAFASYTSANGRPAKTVVYTYSDESGRKIITDMPIGERRVIRD